MKLHVILEKIIFIHSIESLLDLLNKMKLVVDAIDRFLACVILYGYL